MHDTEINLYRVSHRQARNLIIDIFEAGLVPYLRSSPGMGKSELLASIAREFRLWMIDHRLSTSEPTDLTGLPMFENGRAMFAPFKDIFPVEGDPLPVDKDGRPMEGWLLFFDEFNSAERQTQAASYKIILDRKTGQFPLHERTMIALAGNLDTDKAITNPLSTALQSRVVHLELEINFDEWLEDVALARCYDHRIIAYLSQYRSRLHEFDPKTVDKQRAYSSPRTWDFMNRLVKGKPITPEKVPMYVGTISEGTAVDFVQFTKVYDTIVKVTMILSDPDGCPVPQDSASRWATITSVLEHIDEKTVGKLCTYASRFPLDFRILFIRSIQIRHPKLNQHPAVQKFRIELGRYLSPTNIAA